jgi:hypothetical protein
MVEQHRVVQHPFLKAFRAGTLNKKQIRLWAEQQYFFSISLPSCFSVLYARIPYELWKEKQELLELLKIEAWGSTVDGCHSSYFTDLAQFLGVDFGSIAERGYTRNYLAARFDLCANLSRPVAQGLAAIALGNEILNLHLFDAYREGVKQILGLENCPVGYFEAYLSDERADFEVFNSLFQAVGGDLVNAKKGVVEILDQRVLFFDGLFADLK